MSLVDELVALDRPLLVALDVDGTIAPIVRDPDRATVPERTLEVLQRLASTPRMAVALITGRDLASLSRMERLSGIWRGVEHGGLVIAPNEQPRERVLSHEHRSALERFADWVREHAADAFVEFKPHAVAVHVREIAETDPVRADRLLEEAEKLGQRLGLHVRRGRSVREAEAARHDKGEALREIFERTRSATVFFVGDDVTDIPAIEFANVHGVGAFVVSEENPEPPAEEITAIAGTDEIATLLEDLCLRLNSPVA